MNLAALRQHVRDLTGVFSTDVVSDTLLTTWLNEAYNEVARDRDWDWLESTYIVAMPVAVNGIHTINLPNGTRRVLSAYIVGSNGDAEEIIGTSELDHVEPADAKLKYDVTFAGVFRFAPEQTEPKTIKVRYTVANVNMATNTDVPNFAEQFHAMLAYRAAVKVLQFLSDDTARSDYYMSEYANLLSGMYSLYELDHDYRTFQLGVDGVDTKKYFPWFRPA